jgi:hypothetical protein
MDIHLACYLLLSKATMLTLVAKVVTNECRTSCKEPAIFVLFWYKLETSAWILLKFPIIKLHENPFSGLQAISYGRRTDSHDETTTTQRAEHAELT